VTGGVVSLVLGLTLPFHVGLWAALAVSADRRGGSLAVASPMAAIAAAALLVADVSVNPTVHLAGFELGSVHRVFFEVVPGFDGLRSENRIAVLLPPLLAIVGAVGLRRLLALGPLRRRRWAAPAVLVPLGLLIAIDCQPAWQEYEPLPRSDRAPSVLQAAADLHDDAVIAVVKGRGASVTRRQDWDANYFLGHIVTHGKRQVTGYSTYNTPASNAIERAAGMRSGRARLPWVARLAHLFGATHLLIDWREAEAPGDAALDRMLADAGLVLVARDRHLVLAAIGPRDDTAHGPVAAAPEVGGPAIAPASVRGSRSSWRLDSALDGDPETVWSSRAAQRDGPWVELAFDRPVRADRLEFSPGRRIETLPTAFAVELDRGSGWRVVHERSRWQVPRSLIDRPGTGLVSVPLPGEPFERLRLRISADSPFAWNLSRLEVRSTHEKAQ
jgi:hypothetical protein